MEVITLSEKDFFNKYLELKGQIKIKPDIIIGVLNGASYLIEEFKNEKDYNSVTFELITLQRELEIIKRIGLFKVLLKILPYKILDRLRVSEAKKAKKKLKKIDLIELSNQKIDLPISISTELVKNILIVDDAIDTGKTMYLVKNNLSGLFPNANIKIAVISWTIEKSIVKPDYFLFKNVLVRFPWSKDYK